MKIKIILDMHLDIVNAIHALVEVVNANLQIIQFHLELDIKMVGIQCIQRIINLKNRLILMIYI